MNIKISNEVKHDISEIYHYIAKDSLKYANETVNNIYSRIAELKHSPYLGRYVPDFLNKKYREILYKSYRIVYSILEESDTVYVHFVIHCKRNFKSFFNTYISKNKNNLL